MHHPWAYFNDIRGGVVTAVYCQNSLIEFEYQKEGHVKSMTVNFHVAVGSRGDTKYFRCDSIPLPPSKSKHPLSDTIGRIVDVNLYAQLDESVRLEELEIVCEKESYLLFFSENENDAQYAKIEKNKIPYYARVLKQNITMPKELFNVDFFKENLAFALKAHGEQKTPHDLPYSMHYLSVASEVMAALSVEPLSYDEHNVAIACALLHDVNEDTNMQINKDSSIAGNVEVIAKGVAALTKDKTLPKKEQMHDSLERLKKRQKCVGLVKLADRITNLGIPPKHWDEAKRRAYCEEAKVILEALGHTHVYLAAKLEQKILAYHQF